MAKQRNPIRHVYKVVNPHRYKEVRHYNLVEVEPYKPILSLKTNVSKDRNFSNARNVAYWLKERSKDDKKWLNPTTGLKRTANPYIFYGDISAQSNGKHKRKSLLIFRFTENAEKLIIDVYPDYYPHETEILNIVQLLANIK